jgi:rfaE bifunctional protein nucleotidyltransferase chain/domain
MSPELNVVRLQPRKAPGGAPRDKIRTIPELAAIAEQQRALGNVVVHAHGTFDLLHLGHVRHFEAARRLGHVLIVTLTADGFVNKGPGRPVFTEELRAEMLATLEYIDWVGINEAADAVPAIELIHPDIYVKGQDYQNPEGDVTGKIYQERATVESYGGRIHFTDEMTFSSTALVNRHFNVFEPNVRQHLDGLRDQGGLDGNLALLDRVRDYRVVMVGDAIIDEYQYVIPMGKPPKENIIATRLQDREIFAGGVFAAANHAASFCGQVDIITCLGTLDDHEELIRRSLLPNVRLHALRRPGMPTTLKRRFVDPSYMRKLFEVYVMDDDPLTTDLQAELDALIRDICPAADVTVVTDFGHGLIGASAVDTLAASSRFLAVNTQSNSANMGYNLITKYPRADFVCIDAPEARLAVSDRLSSVGDIAQRLLADAIDTPRIIVTHGKHGCVAHERGGPVHSIPAFARKVVDTVGAGDAFFAIAAPLAAAGGDIDRIGFIGNVVGALKVEIVGHRRSIDKPSLVKALTGLLK